MRKKLYLKPKIRIIEVLSSDIIATSGDMDGYGKRNDMFGTNYEEE